MGRIEEDRDGLRLRMSCFSPVGLPRRVVVSSFPKTVFQWRPCRPTNLIDSRESPADTES